MIAALLMAALAGPVPAFGTEQARDGIWSDLVNGAWLSSGGVSRAWMLGWDRDRAPTIKIRQLECRPYFSARRCTFALERTPHPDASAKDRREAGMLKCDTRLVPNEPGMEPVWTVPHRPIEDYEAHSLTTMRCWKHKVRKVSASGPQD